MTSRRALTAEQVGIVHGFRSGLEDTNSDLIAREGLPVIFEDFAVPYRVEKSCNYTPDFLLINGIIVETKGRFVTADRQKHAMVRAQHPDLDIRFVFSRSASKISKASKTTYAKWCEQKGFRYADKVIPTAWMREPVNARSLRAVRLLYEASGRACPV